MGGGWAIVGLMGWVAGLGLWSGGQLGWARLGGWPLRGHRGWVDLLHPEAVFTRKWKGCVPTGNKIGFRTMYVFLEGLGV